MVMQYDPSSPHCDATTTPRRLSPHRRGHHPPTTLAHGGHNRFKVMWNGKPRYTFISLPPDNERAVRAMAILAHHLVTEYHHKVYVEQSMVGKSMGWAAAVQKDSRGVVVDEIDLVITLGGDGTMLYMSRVLFQREVPFVLPFNFGSLGFITPFDFGSYRQHLHRVINKESYSIRRMRLRCQVLRGGCRSSEPYHMFDDNMLMECDTDGKDAEYHVLNEITIDRGAAPYLCNLQVECDGVPFTRVQADGLIIATPTGSTAYSLAAGGSMVHPDVPGILFTPICPHSLSFRPVLLPDYSQITIRIADDSRADSCWLSFDGNNRQQLKIGEQVIVTVSPWDVPTLCLRDSSKDWFESITSQLHWNQRVVQGAKEDDAEEIGQLPPAADFGISSPVTPPCKPFDSPRLPTPIPAAADPEHATSRSKAHAASRNAL